MPAQEWLGSSKFFNTLSWFRDFTTVGGLTHARSSDNKFSRGAWLLVFAVGCVFTALSLKSSIERYLAYEVHTRIEVVKNFLSKSHQATD